MKKLLTILLFFACTKLQAQTANAGADVSINLTSTSTATLDGSASSASSYLWREISTDYMSGATITSPASKTTTVTGLPQGAFYFELAATTGGVTKRDTVVVRVKFDGAPTSGTLIDDLDMATVKPYVNARNDTSDYIGYVTPNNPMGDFGRTYWLERSRLPGMYIDTLIGKFMATIEDGYGWNGNNYARVEAYIGGNLNLDSNKVYDDRWQGYFPQDSFYVDQTGANWHNFVFALQIHGNDSYSPPVGLNVGYNGNVWVGVCDDLGNLADSLTIGQYADFVRQTHTIDLIVKEGQVNGYVKVKVDGITKFFYQGVVGRTPSNDYFKGTGLYDYGRYVVDPSNKTRNRKFSLVTTGWHIYDVTSDTTGVGGTPITPAPTIYAGNNDTTDLTTDTLVATYTIAYGKTATFQWTQTGGSNAATINNPTNSTTTISNLIAGDYRFTVEILQNDGQLDSDYVWVHVNNTVAAPTASISGDQRIDTTATNVYVTANWAPGHNGTYLWSVISGNPVTFSNSTSFSTTVSGLTNGDYAIQCEMTQDDGQKVDKTVNIHVALPAAGIKTSTVFRKTKKLILQNK